MSHPNRFSSTYQPQGCCLKSPYEKYHIFILTDPKPKSAKWNIFSQLCNIVTADGVNCCSVDAEREEGEGQSTKPFSFFLLEVVLNH